MHLTGGFASLQYGSAWGTAVRFCRASATGCAGPVTIGHLDDHGPYAGPPDRLFDFSVRLRDAAGCPSTCMVRYLGGTP